MKSNKFLSILAFLIFSSSCLVTAANKPDAKTEAANAKSKLSPLYAQVDTITDTLLTVRGAGPDLKFVINAETKITKDKAHKEEAKASDVKPDQWVGCSSGILAHPDARCAGQVSRWCGGHACDSEFTA